jgi:hypothetical protein
MTVIALRPAATATRHPCWMRTASGQSVILGVPDHRTINIKDIAAHLAKICRFAGATPTHYSVAQHSVEVAKMCESQRGPLAGMAGLLHDAHEAYLGDTPSPVKALLAAVLPYSPLADLERAMQSAIHQALKLAWPLPEAVAQAVTFADATLLATEWRDLMDAAPVAGMHQPLPRRLIPQRWDMAEQRFLEAFERLSIMAGRQPG